MMAPTTSPSRIILVTGANRGIGHAIVQNLSTDPRGNEIPTTYLLGCRDLAKGKSAATQLKLNHNITAPSDITPIRLDVISNTSLLAAVEEVKTNYGRLDVLINNAGFASVPDPSDLDAYRASFTQIHNVNVTSVAIAMHLFLSLLRKSPLGGSIINISSGRASLTTLAAGDMPPTVSVPYSISKTTLNALTLEVALQKENAGVKFHLANPGHCRTEFNGWRGARDPLEGANVVSELVYGEFEGRGMWETRGDSREMLKMPW